RLRSRVEIDVDARSEADEAVALPALESSARLDIAEDPPRDESRDLHAGHVLSRRRAQVQCIALVFERGFVERCVQEAASVIPPVDHGAIDGAAVRMDIEYVHEDADLQRVAVEVRIA